MSKTPSKWATNLYWEWKPQTLCTKCKFQVCCQSWTSFNFNQSNIVTIIWFSFWLCLNLSHPVNLNLSPVKAAKAENISKNLSLRQLLLKSPSSYWRQQRQRKRCKILLLDVHIDFFLLIALPIFLLTTTIGQVQHLISSGGLKMFSKNLEHL